MLTDMTTLDHSETDTVLGGAEPAGGDAAAGGGEETGNPDDKPDAGEGDKPADGGDKGEDGNDDKKDGATAGAPEKYEFKIEGVEELDSESLGKAEEIFRELNMSNEDAGKLVQVAADFSKKVQEEFQSSMIANGEQVKKDWLDEAMKDPAIGGQKWDETQHLAAKGLDAVGIGKDHPFREVLNNTGFGNHPDLIRIVSALGRMVGEDGKFVRGEGNSKTPDPAKKLYASDAKGA